MLKRFADADVLLVEPNPDHVKALGAILEEAGLRHVRAYTDPREAVDALEGQPDLALVALHMPDLDGYAVLQRLVERAAGTYLPVVILTVDTSTDARRRALQYGAQDFITKPFDATEVLLRVRNLLQTGDLYKELRLHNRWLRTEVDEQRADEQIQHGEHSQQEIRIAAVLRTQDLSMVYQPVADMSTGRIVGVEALCRFPGEPSRPPDVWFAEAERVGFGVDLQLLAIQHALAALEKLPPDVFLAVNLTPAVVLAPPGRLLRMTEGALDRLVLELTEQVPVEDYDVLNKAIEPFREGGARLAVDDTGVGYAGLRHLIALAPEIVKLDRSLTSGIDRDPARRALASALVHFGRDIGAQVVAEGVETDSELEVLRALEVPWGQGYRIARPQPLGDVLPMCNGLEGPPSWL